MFEKVAQKLRFTVQELRVLIFIIAVFLVGFSYKNIFLNEETPPYREFDYSETDSLFNSINEEYKKSGEEAVNNDKNVDYKQEVLDFNKRNFKYKGPKEVPAEKSINLNTAGIEEFTRLPGIGEKTAEKIIELRTRRGKFRKPEELLDVKGIGEVKFSKIKKYIYID